MQIDIYKDGKLQFIFHGTNEEWLNFYKTQPLDVPVVEAELQCNMVDNVTFPFNEYHRFYNACVMGYAPDVDSPVWQALICGHNNGSLSKLRSWCSSNERLTLTCDGEYFHVQDHVNLESVKFKSKVAASAYIRTTLAAPYTLATQEYFMGNEFNDLVCHSENSAGWVSPSGNIWVCYVTQFAVRYELDNWGEKYTVSLIELSKLLSDLNLDLGIFKAAYKLQTERLNGKINN
jgi:hypothetical protein